MAKSPDLGLPLIENQQNTPEITHNEALMLLQAVINGVLSIGDTAPPGSPTDGDAYIVGAGATGAWASKDDKIAIYWDSQSEWLFLPGTTAAGADIPIGARHEGLRIFVRDEDAAYIWTGSAWVKELFNRTDTVAAIDVLDYVPFVDTSDSDTPKRTLFREALNVQGKEISDATYTLAAADAHQNLFFTNPAGCTITLPLEVDVSISTGAVFYPVQMAGTLTFAAPSGVILASPGGRLTTAEQYAKVAVEKIGEDDWLLTGNTA